MKSRKIINPFLLIFSFKMYNITSGAILLKEIIGGRNKIIFKAQREGNLWQYEHND